MAVPRRWLRLIRIGSFSCFSRLAQKQTLHFLSLKRRKAKCPTPSVERHARLRLAEFFLVREVEAQRRDRNISFIDGATVCAFFGLLNRLDGEPEVRPPQRVGAGHDAAIILTAGLPRPAQAARLRRGGGGGQV